MIISFATAAGAKNRLISPALTERTKSENERKSLPCGILMFCRLLFFSADANQSGAKSPVINYGPALCEKGKEESARADRREKKFVCSLWSFCSEINVAAVQKSVSKWSTAPDKMQRMGCMLYSPEPVLEPVVSAILLTIKMLQSQELKNTPL